MIRKIQMKKGEKELWELRILKRKRIKYRMR